MITNNIFYSLINLIKELFKFNTPTDKLLSTYFRNNRKLSSQQRALVAETVYTILRNYYKLTATLNDNIPEIIGITWLKLMQIKPSLFAEIKLINYAKISQLDFVANDLSLFELPQWLITELKLQFTNEELLQLSNSMQQEASLDLRVNILKNNVNNVLKELKAFNPIAMTYSNFGVRVKDKTFLAKHPLFLNGDIEVQDESSQIAGMLLNPKQGDTIVDFCAGAGGKTLLFGMLMRNSGRIYALDINEKRLNNLKPRAARAQLSNIYTMLISSEFDTKLNKLFGKIDKVFVDAPCSGIGTLRRSPELKFRQTLDSINELNKIQLSIITQAAKLVKSNGYLVYATCSILKQENQDIVNKFLTENKNFTLIPLTQVFKSNHFNSQQDYLTLLPHIHGCDGFFAALLQRKE
jgi:16S rRNA (cytosine967-C5)-methyltransferase